MKHVSIDDFKDFCRLKHPNEQYNWNDSKICAVGQYLKHKGMEDGWNLSDPEAAQIITEINFAAYRGDRTFGGLLKRLR